MRWRFHFTNANVSSQQYILLFSTIFAWILFIETNFAALVRFKRVVAPESSREPSAFDLLRLEQQLDFMDPRMGGRTLRDQPRMEEDIDEEHRNGEDTGENAEHGAERWKDDEDADVCRKKCNAQMRMGLDMVKAHSAFGSIGVPSVIDEMDLQLFCRLDAAHDQCLIGCGYQIQFNLRDFVCKRKRDELASHLECYAESAPKLKQQCGVTRCGPYSELELSMIGVGQRCRTLICDIACIQRVLAQQRQHCRNSGQPAAHFLHAYSQFQVALWLREMLGNDAPWQSWPRSCARLLCGIETFGNGNGPKQANGIEAPERWTNCSLSTMISG